MIKKNFTVYSPLTGEILRTGKVREDWIDIQALDGEAVLAVSSDYLTQCVDLETLEIKNIEENPE